MWIVILLVSLRLYSAHGLSVRADPNLNILPNEFGELNTFAVLKCIIEPSNSSVISRWRVSNGTIITNRNPKERLAIDQGRIAGVNVEELGTILVVRNVSYRDAGFYICETTTTATTDASVSTGEGPQWPALAVTELQLNVFLHAVEERVVTNDTATEVELVCEMAGFIRPDEDLQWFRIDGVLSSKNGERYTVTYREGQSNSAQNGGTETVPSRLSVLTVSRPQQSDSGVFECRLNEIALSAEIRLTVLGTDAQSPSNTIRTGQPSSTPLCPVTSTSNQEPLARAQIIGISVACTLVVTVVLTAVLMAMAVQLRKKRQPSKKAFTPALIPKY